MKWFFNMFKLDVKIIELEEEPVEIVEPEDYGKRITSHVSCNVCGKKVSNQVVGDLVIRAFVQCPDCIDRGVR